VSLPAIALVLAAALFHALWNLAVHRTEDRVATVAVNGLVAGVALLPAALIDPPWQVWPLILLSALAETAYALALTAAYRRGQLAIAYPLGRGTSPLLVTLGGWLVLAETPLPPALVGAVALGLGMALVATAGRTRGQGAAVAFALLTGVCIACYSLLDARAVREVSPVGYLGVVFLIQGVLLSACLRREWLPRLRASWRPGVLVAVGSTAAYLLVLLAFQRADAGRVSTLRESSVLIGILLAGERPGPRVWLGATLIVAGAVLAAF
jgi:drug/metabolite transporter (DMT)-like permease